MRSPTASARVRAASALLVALAVVGCGGLVTPPDDLSGWQVKPLAPDSALAQHAMGQPACRSGQPEGFAVRVVLQDRRTPSTAAFLVAGPGFTGSCLVSISGGSAAGSGTTDPQGPVVGSIVVDERSAGSLGNGFATLLGGRSAGDVAGVLVDLAGGQTVEASVRDGSWLAWWPADVDAVRIRALDAAGVVVRTLEPSMPGWLPR